MHNMNSNEPQTPTGGEGVNNNDQGNQTTENDNNTGNNNGNNSRGNSLIIEESITEATYLMRTNEPGRAIKER